MRHMYLVTQYGQMCAVFSHATAIRSWADEFIPKHLRSEYRVHVMPDGATFSPGADNQHRLDIYLGNT